MRWISKALLALVVVAIASVSVFACDCVDKSAAESFAFSDVVFIGEVRSVDRPAWTTTFEVRHWLKGEKTDPVVVTSSGSDCDMWFYPGLTYIVYSREFEGRLKASICSNTKVIDYPRFQLQRRPPQCDFVERRRTYGEIAVITGTCVVLSLGLGALVGAIRNRLR